MNQNSKDIMKNVAAGYAGIGVTMAITSANVLIKDGKDSPSKIAYYSLSNGLLWPVTLVLLVKKTAEIKAAKG